MMTFTDISTVQTRIILDNYGKKNIIAFLIYFAIFLFFSGRGPVKNLFDPFRW